MQVLLQMWFSLKIRRHRLGVRSNPVFAEALQFWKREPFGAFRKGSPFDNSTTDTSVIRSERALWLTSADVNRLVPRSLLLLPLHVDRIVDTSSWLNAMTGKPPHLKVGQDLKNGQKLQNSKSNEWLQTGYRPAKIPPPREAVEMIQFHLDGGPLSEQHVYVSLRREIPIKAQSE